MLNEIVPALVKRFESLLLLRRDLSLPSHYVFISSTEQKRVRVCVRALAMVFHLDSLVGALVAARLAGANMTDALSRHVLKSRSANDSRALAVTLVPPFLRVTVAGYRRSPFAGLIS